MDVIQSLYLTEFMHVVASDLLIPVVVLLLALILYALYSLGSLVVEVFVERRRYRAAIPELLARLVAADPGQLGEVVESSGLLRDQKDDLEELIAYLYLPEEARTEVAKRLLANEDGRYQKILGHTELAAKVAPMLGLMGTLIPLGPGIVALSTGDTETLSAALLVAFDTTIAGLATAVVCFGITRLRRRWYGDYLVSMEAVFNTLLEKGETMHEDGYDFTPLVLAYDRSGRHAKAEPLVAGEALAAGEGVRRAMGAGGDAADEAYEGGEA